MTKDTPPQPELEWEPIIEGIELCINQMRFSLPTTSVRELRDDMEEAAMLSRGLEKHELMADEVDKGDWIILMGDAYRVHSTLRGYDAWVIQFELNAHSRFTSEVLVPPDQQVTVWRPVAG